MGNFYQIFNIATTDPQNVSLETYRKTFPFSVKTNRIYANEYTYKFGYLMVLRGYIMVFGGIASITLSIVFCLLFTEIDAFRQTFMQIPLPEWAWPWNHLSREFMLQNLVDGNLLLSKNEIDTYLRVCDFVSLFWLIWLILISFANVIIVGGFDVRKALITLAVVAIFLVWASAQNILLYKSIAPSVYDDLLCLALKKTIIISFTYFILTYFITILIVQFKRRPRPQEFAEDIPE
ncbi:hypothetical protein [Labrys miyagiensis]|uniref:hypothetical protein n=1 Tax=Labrys miyagiensis TaxID=346912 RepID=UPI0024E0AF5A|nr:hypothetical protein [Labrys miyagiensis]